MAFTLDVDDDHWPSLAPIRTTAPTSSASLPATCGTPCHTSNLKPDSFQDGSGASCRTVSSSWVRSAPSSPSEPDCPEAAANDLARQASCCSTSKKIGGDLFCCFSCTKQTSSPRRQRRCTAACLRKDGPVLRSMAFFSPAASGFQSFYSSPRGKAAQLSGAFPRTPSAGKLQHYASPRTPGNHPFSGKIQHYPSPRTPSSGNLQCLSTPRTPASGRVQHFAGAIPSSRTPFGSGAASPSSAGQRKSSFTLFMPPATADKKMPEEELEEPTSPHVTCIGRVRRQTAYCKKPHLKDIINPHASSHDTKSKIKKGKVSKKPHSAAFGPYKCHVSLSNEAMKRAGAELSTTEACDQKFGKSQLHNLHKINGFRDESSDANDIRDGVALDCNQGDDIMPAANGHISDVESINGNMRSLQKADHGNMHSDVDKIDKCVESPELPVEITASMLYTTCNRKRNELHQEVYDEAQCLEIINKLQHEANLSQSRGPAGLQINACKTPAQPGDRCLLLSMRNTSRRGILSDFDTSSIFPTS